MHDKLRKKYTVKKCFNKCKLYQEAIDYHFWKSVRIESKDCKLAKTEKETIDKKINKIRAKLRNFI